MYLPITQQLQVVGWHELSQPNKWWDGTRMSQGE